MIPPPLSSGQTSTRGQRRSRHEDHTAKNYGSNNDECDCVNGPNNRAAGDVDAMFLF